MIRIYDPRIKTQKNPESVIIANQEGEQIWLWYGRLQDLQHLQPPGPRLLDQPKLLALKSLLKLS